MPLWRLTAASEKAKSYVGPHGSDLVLDEGRETHVGRAVSGEASYCLPAEWLQISSRHCRLFFDHDKGCWHVVDTSTNGTFQNGVRLPKGVPTALAPGDRVRLSVIPPAEPQNVYEYVLERLEGAPAPPPGPAASGVQVTPGRAMAGGAAGGDGVGAHKRKEGDSAVSESMPTANKRARAAAGQEQSPPGEGGAAAGASAAGGGSLQEMIALRQNNLTLRGELEAEKQAKRALEEQFREGSAALEKQHREAEAALQRQHQEAEGALEARHREAEAELERRHREAEAEWGERLRAAQQAAGEARQRAAEEVAQAKAEASAAQAATEVAQQAEQEATAEAQRLGQELEGAQQSAAQARAELEAERAQREALAGQLAAEQERHGRMEEALGLAQAEVGRLQGEVAVQQEARAAAEQRTTEREDEAAQQEQRAQQLAAELQAAQQRAADAEARCSRQAEELGQLQQAHDALRCAGAQREEQLQRELADARAQLQSMERREDNLRERQLVVQACIRHIQSFAQQFSANKQTMDAYYDQLARAKAEADNSYTAMMQQVEAVTRFLDDADSLRPSGTGGAAAEPAGPEAAPTALGAALAVGGGGGEGLAGGGAAGAGAAGTLLEGLEQLDAQLAVVGGTQQEAGEEGGEVTPRAGGPLGGGGAPATQVLLLSASAQRGGPGPSQQQQQQQPQMMQHLVGTLPTSQILLGVQPAAPTPRFGAGSGTPHFAAAAAATPLAEAPAAGFATLAGDGAGLEQQEQAPREQWEEGAALMEEDAPAGPAAAEGWEEGGADSEDQLGAAASMEHDVAGEGEAMEEDVASPAAAQPLAAAAVPPSGEGEAAAVSGAVPALEQEQQQAAAGDADEVQPQPESQQLPAAAEAGSGPAAAAEGGDDDATDADEEAELAQGSGRLSVILPDEAGEAAEGTPVSPAGAAGGSAAAPPAAVVAHSLGCAGSGGGESQFFKDTEQPAAEDVCLSGDSDEGPAVDEDFGAAGAEGEGPAAQAGQQLQLGSRDSPAGRQRSPPPQLPPEALKQLEQQPAGLWAVDAEEQQQQAPLAEDEGDPAEGVVEGEEEEEDDDSMRRWAQVVGTDENRQSVGNTPGHHPVSQEHSKPSNLLHEAIPDSLGHEYEQPASGGRGWQ